eukprot:772489-Pelagomonas_calceolata.AAC.2
MVLDYLNKGDVCCKSNVKGVCRSAANMKTIQHLSFSPCQFDAPAAAQVDESPHYKHVHAVSNALAHASKPIREAAEMPVLALSFMCLKAAVNHTCLTTQRTEHAQWLLNSMLCLQRCVVGLSWVRADSFNGEKPNGASHFCILLNVFPPLHFAAVGEEVPVQVLGRQGVAQHAVHRLRADGACVAPGKKRTNVHSVYLLRLSLCSIHVVAKRAVHCLRGAKAVVHAWLPVTIKILLTSMLIICSAARGLISSSVVLSLAYCVSHCHPPLYCAVGHPAERFIRQDHSAERAAAWRYAGALLVTEQGQTMGCNAEVQPRKGVENDRRRQSCRYKGETSAIHLEAPAGPHGVHIHEHSLLALQVAAPCKHWAALHVLMKHAHDLQGAVVICMLSSVDLQRFVPLEK